MTTSINSPSFLDAESTQRILSLRVRSPKRRPALLSSARNFRGLEHYPSLSVDYSCWERSAANQCACFLLSEAVDLREKYLLAAGQPPPLCKAQLYVAPGGTDVCVPDGGAVPPAAEFWADYERVLDICAQDAARSYAVKRLTVLEYNYEFHRLLNGAREAEATKVCSLSLSLFLFSLALFFFSFAYTAVAVADTQSTGTDNSRIVRVDNSL